MFVYEPWTGFNEAYEPAPLDGPNDRERRRRIAQDVNRINQGKLNCVYGTITLNANATSTTITDPRIGMTSWIGLMPTTDSAVAIDIAPRIKSQTKGSAVITHGSSTATDLNYAVVILG